MGAMSASLKASLKGLEPSIFGSGNQRLIHLATGTDVRKQRVWGLVGGIDAKRFFGILQVTSWWSESSLIDIQKCVLGESNPGHLLGRQVF